jgi:predicted RNA-binding protein with TRAM domain
VWLQYVVGFVVQISTIPPGDTVEIEIVRDGQKAIKRGTMKERPGSLCDE